MNASKQETVFRGIAVSPGMVLGQAIRLDSRNRVVLKLLVDEDRVADEVVRFEVAVQASKRQLKELKDRLEKKIGPEHSFILDVHLLMLEDASLHSEIVAVIRSARANAEWAVRQVTDRVQAAYASLQDEYFRERGSDIESVVERILFNLSGDRPLNWVPFPDNLIVVAQEFSPSSFALLDIHKVRGLALESGGRTSHTAIISRGLRLPAVMGVRDLIRGVATGDSILLNGDEGILIVNPTPERLSQMSERLDLFLASADPVAHAAGAATFTKDGTRVCLRANTDLPEEVRAARLCGAEGIGLFRTEYLFFAHPKGFPGVEAQFEVYRMLAEGMRPYTVSIRTLDIGADKIPGVSGESPAVNANMGLRGIRRSLANRATFREQIEAVLRASQFGELEIVLPMVTTIEEIRETRALLEKVRSEMAPETALRLNLIPLGVMIEVPAAVLALEAIARESDFLSVGTNDLIQYMLAVDRSNPQVSYLYQPLHPSILHCLSHIARVSAAAGKPVRICGEMSSNPFFVFILLGMGFRDLSMNAFSIPKMRRIIQDIDLDQARKIAADVLTFQSAREIGEYLINAVSTFTNVDLSLHVKEIRASNSLA